MLGRSIDQCDRLMWIRDKRLEYPGRVAGKVVVLGRR